MLLVSPKRNALRPKLYTPATGPVFDTAQRSGSSLLRNRYASGFRRSMIPGGFKPGATRSGLTAGTYVLPGGGSTIKAAATEPVLAPGSPGTPGNPIAQPEVEVVAGQTQSALLWSMGALAVFFLLRR